MNTESVCFADVLAMVRPHVIFLADTNHAPGAVAAAAAASLPPHARHVFAEFPVAELSAMARWCVERSAVAVYVVCSSVKAATVVHQELLASPIAGICHHSPPEEPAGAMHERERSLEPPYIMTYCEEFPAQEGGQ